MPINVKMLPVKIWWTKVHENQKSAKSRVKEWKKEILGPLLAEFNATLNEVDALDKQIANPKLKKKLWDDPNFLGRVQAIINLPAEVEKPAYKKQGAKVYVMIKEAHESFQALNREAKAALEEYKLEQDEKYEFRQFSVPLLSKEGADKLNALLKPTGMVIHPSTCDILVALRASSDEALDMTKEWDGIDKYIADNKADLSDLYEVLEDNVSHTVRLFEKARALEDEAQQKKDLGAATQLFLKRLQEAAGRAADKARDVIHEVAGTTYLIQKRARVYKRVRIKHYTYAALSGGSAVARLALTGGLDPTAYYQLARSIISAASLALRDLLNDASTALEKVRADIQEMNDSIDKAQGALSSVQWKDRGLASFNMAFRTLIGTSVPLAGGNLAAYRQDHLLFANKLAALRQELAARSIEVQKLILTLKEEGGDLVPLSEDLAERWSQVHKDISVVDKTYTATFVQAEAALDAYCELIGGWFRPHLDKGLVTMDAVASLQRALDAYDTTTAATGTATLADLIGQGLEAAVSLAA